MSMSVQYIAITATSNPSPVSSDVRGVRHEWHVVVRRGWCMARTRLVVEHQLQWISASHLLGNLHSTLLHVEEEISCDDRQLISKKTICDMWEEKGSLSDWNWWCVRTVEHMYVRTEWCKSCISQHTNRMGSCTLCRMSRYRRHALYESRWCIISHTWTGCVWFTSRMLDN